MKSNQHLYDKALSFVEKRTLGSEDVAVQRQKNKKLMTSVEHRQLTFSRGGSEHFYCRDYASCLICKENIAILKDTCKLRGECSED